MIHDEKDIKQAHIVGDIHFGVRNNSTLWFEIQQDFLLNIFPRQLAENGHDPKTSILILEGDIFHSRQSIDVKVFSHAIEIFAKLSEMFRTIYIILGNHDVYYKDNNSINSVVILSKLFKNIKVFDTHQVLRINKTHNFLLLPWIESPDKLTQTVELYSGKCQYIICHADIQGAKLNSFAKLDKGVHPKTLASYKKIYSGHIHIRQEIKKHGANVLFTGTPYSMDKGDVGNQKGFDILTFTDDLISEKFIPNSESPIFIKKNLYSILEMNINEVNELFKNNFVEIMIENKIANRFSVNSFIELVKDSGYKKIEFSNYSKIQKMDSAEIVKQMNGADIDLSIPNMMSSYVEQKGYDRILKNKVQAKFIELYDRVKELTKTEE